MRPSLALADNAEREIIVSALPSPEVHGPVADTRNGDGVFNSIPIRVKAMPAAKKWEAVIPSIVAEDFRSCAHGVDCTATNSLRRAIESANDRGTREKLEIINRTVNRVLRYQTDMENYGLEDYWATPIETLVHGRGDCEDYAILKMAAAKEAGISLEAMSVVVVRDTHREVYHAVLAVRTKDGYFILDNLEDEVRLDQNSPEYQPLYSVSVDKMWLHGVRRQG